MDKEEEKKEEQALPDEEAQQTEETAPEDGAPSGKDAQEARNKALIRMTAPLHNSLFMANLLSEDLTARGPCERTAAVEMHHINIILTCAAAYIWKITHSFFIPGREM